MQPGVPYREVHDLAAQTLVAGLASTGLFKGDSADVVDSGAYALLFPHGLGHHIGLDVHDMEALGENRVGYGEGVERSTEFGRRSLRLGRPLREGWVVTVEPGIYLPGFGGVRIEDDVLVTRTGHEVLTSVPKRWEEAAVSVA